MSAINFNAKDYNPSTGAPGPVPIGYYQVAISKSEMKPTKKGDGKVIEFFASILDEGPFKGKTIRWNINWENPNPTAMQIGREELSAICYATGVMQPQDTSQLHNIALGVEVHMQQNWKYNEIAQFMPATKVAELQAAGTEPAPLPHEVNGPPPTTSPAAPGGGPAPAPAPAPVAAAPPMASPQPVESPPPGNPVPASAAPTQEAPAPVTSPAPASVATPPPVSAPTTAPSETPPAPTAETPAWIAAQQAAQPSEG